MQVEWRRWALLALLGCWMAGRAGASDRTPPCADVVAAEWDRAAVEVLLTELAVDPTRDLQAVVVQRQGCLLVERYFNGADADRLHDICSATKSITATLVLMAIEQGLIQDLDQPISALLPAGMSPDRPVVRVRDVLTMRSGHDSDDEDTDSLGNENRMDEAADWQDFARGVPLKWTPGERYVYSSFTAFLAGAMVEQVSGQSLQAFAVTHLFEPLGIRRYAWRRRPRGEGVGQGNLSLTARDMVKIGTLYLQRGRMGSQQLIQAHWIEQALTPQVRISEVDPYADAYGYMWYFKQYPVAGRTVTVHFASGNGGNKIYLVPELDLVMAITSSAYGQRHGQRRSERILLRVLDALPGPEVSTRPALQPTE